MTDDDLKRLYRFLDRKEFRSGDEPEATAKTWILILLAEIEQLKTRIGVLAPGVTP